MQKPTSDSSRFAACWRWYFFASSPARSLTHLHSISISVFSPLSHTLSRPLQLIQRIRHEKKTEVKGHTQKKIDVRTDIFVCIRLKYG